LGYRWPPCFKEAIGLPSLIGESLTFKGDISGTEDLTIDGTVEGTIRLPDHTLTIGPKGNIRSDIWVTSAIVLGAVTGSITASHNVELRNTASVEGDVVAPRIAMSDGACFHGSIDMKPSRAEEGRQ
jgi:cytoskeletal protein CcmA (bactofilin family)